MRAIALRRHWLLISIVACGAALRVVTQFAYRPALFYQDSFWYLHNAARFIPLDRKPLGYPAFLDLLPIGHGLAVIPAVQHALGLVIALLIYVLLLRIGVRPWLAALATVPLVLDAFQLLIEQFVLSETLFELLLVAACAALLWRRPLPVWLAGGAGLLLAAATLTRIVALVLILPVAVLLAADRRWRALAVAVAAFALPLAGYAAWYHAIHDEYRLTGPNGRFLYARVAPFTDCTRVRLPASERPLCPTQPPGARPAPHDFAWNSRSPINRVPSRQREALAGSFAKRVIRAQPLDYAGAVLSDLAHGFAFERSTPRRRVSFAELWMFQPAFPRPGDAREALREHGDSGTAIQPSLVAFLLRYQRLAFTPGPLLALGLLAGLLAAWRAQRPQLRAAGWLFASLGFLLALGPAMLEQLLPRYELPLLVLLAPALAVGVEALGGLQAPRAWLARHEHVRVRSGDDGAGPGLRPPAAGSRPRDAGQPG